LRAAAGSGQFMQLMTMLSGLFAGGSAQVAAGEAEQAAQSAESVADAVATNTAAAPAVDPTRAAPTHDVPTPPEP
jgi:hypothetical protein